MKQSLTIILFILLGCNSQKSSETCDEISMQKFRGVPMANKRFEENCRDAKITYTAELCQSALGELIQTKDLTKVKLKFGAPVEKCFTEADLKRFNRS